MTDLTSLDLVERLKALAADLSEPDTNDGRDYRPSPDAATVLDALSEILRLRDPNRAMEAEYDKITAAENVLTWLLIEKLGCSDEGPCTPDDAQRHIVAALDQLKAAESEIIRLRALITPGEGCETTEADREWLSAFTAPRNAGPLVERRGRIAPDRHVPPHETHRRRPDMSDALDKALPCPFCGAQPHVDKTAREYDAEGGRRGEYAAWYTIRCDECGAEKDAEYRSEAIAAWNSRSAAALSAPETGDAGYRITREEQQSSMEAALRKSGYVVDTIDPRLRGGTDPQTKGTPGVTSTAPVPDLGKVKEALNNLPRYSQYRSENGDRMVPMPAGGDWVLVADLQRALATLEQTDGPHESGIGTGPST